MIPILIAVIILVLSIVLAWLVGPLLGLAGTALLVLRIASSLDLGESVVQGVVK